VHAAAYLISRTARTCLPARRTGCGIKPSELKTIATGIQKGNGDATVSAVLHLVKSAEIKQQRTD
jgi:hypothetical protein